MFPVFVSTLTPMLMMFSCILLGYLLATLSVVGMFKFYAIVTFIVPVLALALPLLDTLFAALMAVLVIYMHRANIKRLLKGEERRTTLFGFISRNKK